MTPEDIANVVAEDLDAHIPDAAKVKGPDTSLSGERLASLSVDELRVQRDVAQAAVDTGLSRLKALDAELMAPSASATNRMARSRVEAAQLRTDVRERMRERLILDQALTARDAGEVQP